MNHIGSPDEWLDLIDPMVPDIIALIIESWESMPVPAANAKEDPISEDLCRLLRNSRTARSDLLFRIDSQMVELEPAAGEEQGRMDIVFSPLVPREDIYFCLECKRLNVRDANGDVRPYHAEYVRFGMLRFVRGQYSRTVRHAGMLAFVLDGDATSAVEGVTNNIRKYCKELRMAPPGGFSPSTVRPDDGRLRESRHARNDDSEIRIHHLFMAGDDAAPFVPAPPKSAKKAKRKSP